MYWEGLQSLCDAPEPQGDNTHVISVSHPNGSNPSPMQLSRIDTNGWTMALKQGYFRNSVACFMGQKMRREVTNTESKIGEFL